MFFGICAVGTSTTQQHFPACERATRSCPVELNFSGLVLPRSKCPASGQDHEGDLGHERRQEAAIDGGH